MRTTLDIDDNVLAAARAIADARRISMGAALSELARRGLERAIATPAESVDQTFYIIAGNPDHIVTPELIAAHLDDE
jgi:hypothetical protein